MTVESPKTGWAPWPVLLLSLVITLAAAWLVFGGAQLAALGGSWYFVIAGLALLVTAWLLARRNVLGFWLYMLVLAATAAWSVWEVGFAFWPLVSRLAAPAVVAVLVALSAPTLTRGGRIGWTPALAVTAVLVVALGAMGWRMFQPVAIVEASKPLPSVGTVPAQPANWASYGRSPMGTRFAPDTQITPENVSQLQVAWTYRTGDVPPFNTGVGSEDQNTPMQVGDTVYSCSPHNIVSALNAETGELRWKFNPEAAGTIWQRCRSVAYYESNGAISVGLQALVDAGTVPAPVLNAGEQCQRRVVMTTVDARLIQIDAATGEICTGFGENGIVNLKQNMGEFPAPFYFQTSMPTVADGLVVVGGWVADNVTLGEPSGVVRAFDAETGILVWAWDLGRPETTRLPPEGETYTPGTPNVWSTIAYDAERGMIYLPTGNATPDFFGGNRRPFDDEYNASIVALDVQTGREQWRFRTVNHDIWDYDVPAQPALFDLPNEDGSTTPALIQVTKRGQIFVLNRETGEPVFEVEQRAVPQDTVEGEYTAPTQPYSVGMPAIGAERLTESRMWGATPFDQLWCRIEFRKMRYEGDFTPAALNKSTILWPGYGGGMNWGSASVHLPSGYLLVNDIRSANLMRLISREEADAAPGATPHGPLSRMAGTPYGARLTTFFSPLGVPCQEPPFGTLTAIDMGSQSIAWQVPIGTVEDSGPLGITTGLHIPIGMPTVGGSVTTASGLAFFSGTLDNYLRAIDMATGKELWRDRLPVGTQMTPLVYTSPESGRQFIVVSAGGARYSTERGDYVIAYALPKN